MREISVSRIEEAVCRMVQQINYAYPPQIETDMKRMAEEETHPIARSTLQFLLDNARIAKEEHIPICQDTGMAVIFMKIGQDVHASRWSAIRCLHESIRKTMPLPSSTSS